MDFYGPPIPIAMEDAIMSSMENLHLTGETCIQKSGVLLKKSAGDGEEDEGIAQEFESPSKNDEIEGSDTIRFNPPVYRQRYAAVREVLANFLKDPSHKDVVNGNTVMEVGCAEYGMHFFYKSLLELGKIIFMDLDEDLLEDRKHQLRPLPVEHLLKITRPKPLVMEAYAGCITKVDTRIIEENPKVWAIVAIELVEHLYPDILRGFEISVFAVIAPSIVIVTTPNSDFNPIFNLAPGKFRHWDHKFEWTRQEFVSWCEKICSEFSDYEYSVAGICAGPPETEHMGSVSQMAIFQKIVKGFTKNNNPIIYPGVIQNGAYKLIESVEYPNYIEKRTDEEIILQEFDYTVRNYWLSRRNVEHYMEIGKTELCFNLKELPTLLQDMPEIICNPELVKNMLLSAKYNVRVNESGEYSVILPISHWDDGEDEDSMDDYEESMDDEPVDNNASDVLTLAQTEDDNWE